MHEFTAEQGIQEHEYTFPYHYLPELRPFSQARNLWWGYEYASYIEYLVETFNGFGFESLLDVGCGDGRLLYELASSGVDRKLTGTDFSAKALAFARAFCPPTVTLTEQMPQGGRFDAFAAIEVFEHIPPEQADAFLSSIANSLAANARGMITVPTANVPLNPKHYRHFTAETLHEALERHFVVESIEFLNARTGTAWIVQRLLANRFFILNWQPLREILFAWYKRTSLKARPDTAMRLVATVRTKT